MTSPVIPAEPTPEPTDEPRADPTEAMGAAEHDGPRPPGWRRPVVAALVALTYLLGMGGAALVNLDVTPGNCAARAATNFGDGTAGGVWLTYLFDTDQIGPGDGFEESTGPREGEQVWTAEVWTQTLTMAPLWVATRFVGPVCGFNLALAGSFAVSALAMGVLAWHLTRRLLIAGVAGYVFAFSALAVGKSTGHIAYVQQWPFALLVLGLICSWFSGSKRGVVLAGAALGLAPWTDGYYLPFIWITTAVVTLGLVLFNRAPGEMRGRLLRLAAIAAIGIAIQLPLVALVAMGGTSEVTGAPTRPFTDAVGEFDLYGARPQDFVTPDARSAFSGLVDKREAVIEANVYLGLPLLALCVAGVIAWLVLRRRPNPPPMLALAPTIVVSGLVIAYMCGPARPHLFGLELPNPFGLAANYVPLWRVPSRMGIAVMCLVVAGAAIAANTLVGLVRGSALRIGLAVALVAFVGLDHVRLENPGYLTFDYSQAPPGYKWLATLRDVDRIVEYPTTDPNGGFSTFQPVHRKHLVNSKQNAGVASNEAMAGLGDKQTPALLRAFGVDLVVVHPTMMGADGPFPSRDYRLVNEYDPGDIMPGETPAGRAQINYIPEWYRMDVYEVAPGPEATGLLAFGDGWYPLEVGGYGSSRWASGTSSEITPMAFDESADRCEVSLDVSSFGRERDVTVRQGDEELWSGRTDGTTTLTFEAACGEEATISVAGALTPVSEVQPDSTDPRSLGLRVANGVTSVVR